MTQEAYDIAKAFRDGRKLSRKRTNTTDDGNRVYLHGNCIAWRDPVGMVWMSLAGWGTITTRDRLNAICDVFGFGRPFHQRKFRQFYGDREVYEREHVPLCGPLAMQAILAEQGRLAA